MHDLTILLLLPVIGAVSIAESIENETLREAVLHMGVKCGQGYHFARPAIAEKAFSETGSASSEELRVGEECRNR